MCCRRREGFSEEYVTLHWSRSLIREEKATEAADSFISLLWRAVRGRERMPACHNGKKTRCARARVYFPRILTSAADSNSILFESSADERTNERTTFVHGKARGG
jgi:hypothetical protein